MTASREQHLPRAEAPGREKVRWGLHESEKRDIGQPSGKLVLLIGL